MGFCQTLSDGEMLDSIDLLLMLEDFHFCSEKRERFIFVTIVLLKGFHISPVLFVINSSCLSKTFAESYVFFSFGKLSTDDLTPWIDF